jgi:hypothetical protein
LLYIYTVISGSHVLGVFHTMRLAAHTMGLVALAIGQAALLVEFQCLGFLAMCGDEWAKWRHKSKKWSDTKWYYRPFTCMDTFTPCIFLLNLGTQYLSLNLGTIFHKCSKQLLLKNAWILRFSYIILQKCMIKHKRNTRMTLSHLYTACKH